MPLRRQEAVVGVRQRAEVAHRAPVEARVLLAAAAGVVALPVPGLHTVGDTAGVASKHWGRKHVVDSKHYNHNQEDSSRRLQGGKLRTVVP